MGPGLWPRLNFRTRTKMKIAVLWFNVFNLFWNERRLCPTLCDHPNDFFSFLISPNGCLGNLAASFECWEQPWCFHFCFCEISLSLYLKQKDDSFYKLRIVLRKEGEGGVGKEKDEPVFSRSLCLEEASRNFSCMFQDFFFLDRLSPGPLRGGRGPVLDRGYCCKRLLLQQLDLDLLTRHWQLRLLPLLPVIFVNSHFPRTLSWWDVLELSFHTLGVLLGCLHPSKAGNAREKTHLPSVLAATPILKILCTLDKGHHGCPSCLRFLGNLAIPGRENWIRVEFKILHAHSHLFFPGKWRGALSRCGSFLSTYHPQVPGNRVAGRPKNNYFDFSNVASREKYIPVPWQREHLQFVLPVWSSRSLFTLALAAAGFWGNIFAYCILFRNPDGSMPSQHLLYIFFSICGKEKWFSKNLGRWGIPETQPLIPEDQLEGK